MKSILCGLTFSVLMAAYAAPALAKDPTDGKSAAIATEKVLCARSFIAPKSKGVAYKPGVDVRGKPVLTADLNDQSQIVNEYIDVPLTLDLLEKFNAKAPAGMEFKPEVGRLKLYKNGKVEYNGQDVTKTAADVCGIAVSSYSTHYPTDYAAPPATPESQPIAGSVAASSTGPIPTSVREIRRGTVNQ